LATAKAATKNSLDRGKEETLMFKVLVALLIGLGIGYYWGYGEGFDKQPSVLARSLDRFGLSRVRQAQNSRERTVQDALKP
jgi:hypothetical protein